jgi:hypothetical protein
MYDLAFYFDDHADVQIHIILRYNLPKMGLNLHIGMKTTLPIRVSNFFPKK